MAPTRPRSGASSARWPPRRSPSTGAPPPVLRRPDRRPRRRPVPRRADQPGVDPRRPARRELRHLHERLRRSLVFNVNDFDEAYVGPFTWDLKRFAASVALIGYAKALSDDLISDAGRPITPPPTSPSAGDRAGGDDAIGSLTLDTTRPACCAACSSTPAQHPVRAARRADQDRRLRAPLRDAATASSRSTRRAATRCCAAFDDYLKTLPADLGSPRPIATAQGRGAAQGRRHRLGRPAVVQHAAGGPHPGAGERRRDLHEAGADARRSPGTSPTSGSAATSSTRATARRVAARAAGARRPVAGLHRAGRRRASWSPRSRRTRPTWTGPTSTSRRSWPRCSRDLGRAAARMHSVADDESEPLPGRLLHRAGHRRRDRRGRAGLRGAAGRLRPRVRRPRPPGPPDLRGPVPQRPAPRAVAG